MISGLSLTQINDVMQTSNQLEDPLNLTNDQVNELVQLYEENMENFLTEEQEEQLRQYRNAMSNCWARNVHYCPQKPGRNAFRKYFIHFYDLENHRE